MNLRTITCWVVYNPKRRAIVNGHRTQKELKTYYSAGIPIGCVIVKMKGHYPSTTAAKDEA
jgi:hypothetical protein